MNLKKVDVGVWTKGVDCRPDEEDEIIIKDSDGRLRIAQLTSEGFYKFSNRKLPSIELEWLKPIKQVYVLTDLEIKMMLEQYKTALLNQENIFHPIIEDFVNSITQ